MSKTRLIVALAALASLSSVAAADGYDASLKDVASPTTVNWSGLYFGGHVGYGWADISSNHDLDMDFDAADNFLNSFGRDTEGWLAGGHIGVQHQHGNWVFGIEGTYDAMNLDGSSSSEWSFDDTVCTFNSNGQRICNGPSGSGTQSLRTEIDHLVTITGRVGYAWDRWLAYVKGGYARAEVGVSAQVAGSLGNCINSACFGDSLSVSGSSKKDHDGWTVGAGGEYLIHKNVALGFEYDYIKLTSEAHVVDGNSGFASPASLMIDVDPDAIHAVSARLSILLNQ